MHKCQGQDSYETWYSMVSRETEPAYFRDKNFYKTNPDIQPEMRAILIDWLINVSAVYKLQRKTLYMAIDYVDRYLSRSSGIQKTTLQLIGITSLLIASKIEETYPPKLSQFCYMADGACTTDEMLAFEKHILQDVFASQLLDLCLMCTESLQFGYHLLAAVTISFYIMSIITVTQITALSCDEMEDCYRWILPFYEVLEAESNASVALLEKVKAYREALKPSNKLMGSRPSRRSQSTPQYSLNTASASGEPSNV
ncbi:hypothetical protein HELRODRAFT_170018 [Helobdella robusta]|uniref:Cyclin-like domain-containing protein n=1 Tax=Helobdella robusta TaxID=6412 RepID=T1F2J4_HELRO|nr:hypothetical protein HELRODRAFT_170018 [Helobdella robusta]ESO07486.1 hypothetical protein HELRODRAFT_170018 [Helobdella robusta]